jgi:hypothetical protein
MNTLGAVVGAFGSTFFIIQQLGTRNTLWLACLVNAVTACTAFAISRGRTSREAPQAINASKSDGEIAAPTTWNIPTYAVAGIAGFSFFLMELVWYRMLGPILGGTTFTFGLILTVALAGIGLGAAAYALLFSGRRKVSIDVVALICVLEACCILLPFALGDEVALLTARLREANTQQFAGVVSGWFLVAGIVVFPAAFVSGLQFPMLLALLGQGDVHIGKQVGRVFVWNTVGAISGALAGGFGLLPLLSAPGVWRAVGILLVLQSVVLVGWARRAAKWNAEAFVTLLLTALGLFMSFGTGPSAVWRHSGIGAGRGGPMTSLESRNSSIDWQNFTRRTCVWETDGVESSVAIRQGDGFALFVNGKSDGDALGDAGTQIWLGLIGAALHPEPKTALVVGLGTGETAGWLAEVPSISRVDVVELEPAVCEVARRCRGVNFDVLEHPKVRLNFNDAREALLTGKDRYDLIVSEPSNPYRSGIAGLFTREFYRAGRARLEDGGIFVQWLQAYEMDERTLRTVLTTFGSVFPQVEIWQTMSTDLALVGSLRPPACSATNLRTKLAAHPFAPALVRAWHTTDLEGFFGHYVGGQALIDAILETGDATINTDDRNELEYAFARTVGVKQPSLTGTLYRMSNDCDDQKHPVTAGQVNWDAVELERQWLLQAELASSVNIRQLNPVLERFVANDMSGVLTAWESSDHNASCLRELAVVAMSYATKGDAKSGELAASLQNYLPIEADLIRGILAYKQKNAEESSKLLAGAFIQLRHDPWPMKDIVHNALDWAHVISDTGPEHASRLLDALAEPFLVFASEDKRRSVCLIIAPRAKQDAVPFLEIFETYVPWQQEFLTFRKQVYTKTNHPLAHQADLDLERFLKNAARERTMPKKPSR